MNLHLEKCLCVMIFLVVRYGEVAAQPSAGRVSKSHEEVQDCLRELWAKPVFWDQAAVAPVDAAVCKARAEKIEQALKEEHVVVFRLPNAVLLTKETAFSKQGGFPYYHWTTPKIDIRLIPRVRPGSRQLTESELHDFAGVILNHSHMAPLTCPFDASEFFTASPPGFVWDARIRMGLTTVRVRDGYVTGVAVMRGAVASIVDVVNAPESVELNSAALQRYLVEAVCMPTALVPGSGVSWSSVDDLHATATLTDGLAGVSVRFEFAPSGEIVAASLHRYRSIEGKFELTPAGCVYRDYAERSGMRVPVAGEMYWEIGGRAEPYCKLRVVDFDFQLAV